MRATTMSYADASGWVLSGPPPVDTGLVIYFGARRDLAAGTAWFDGLRARFPAAHVVGCSTGGQIDGAAIADQGIAALALSFERTGLRVASEEIAGPGDSRRVGARLGSRLAGDDLSGIFVLSDGLKVNGSALVEGLREGAGRPVSITGGLAGDGPDFSETLVGADALPRPGVAVALGLYGSGIRIGHGSEGGWDQFGPRRRVTRSSGNVLHELDGEPALDLYERYLGDEAAGLPSTGLLFPLRIYDPARPDHDLVRTILAIDREARTMTFAGDIPEGWVAQLMRGNLDRLALGAARAAARARDSADRASPPAGDSAAILVSCIGRRLLMGQYCGDEIEAAGIELGPETKRIGFYSYGEFSPHAASGICQLHNQTMTITTLSEAAA